MLALLVSTVSCGKKMPPVPPSQAVPREATEFSSAVTDRSVILTWKPPLKRKDGSPVEISGFKIYKGMSSFAEDCPGCPVRFTKAFFVNWARVGKDGSGNHTARFEDKDVAYGQKYTYAVQAINEDGWEGEVSDPIAVYFDAPPGSPSELKAQAGDGWVKLTWKAPEPAGSVAVTGPVYYHLYRREGNGPFRRLTVPGNFAETVIEDHAVINGTAYAYKIKSFRDVKGTFIEGGESNEATALPEAKRESPPPPRPE